MRVTEGQQALDQLSDTDISAAVDLLRLIKQVDVLYTVVKDPRARPLMNLIRAGLVDYVFADSGKVAAAWIPKRRKKVNA